jgi:hypothetical protein
MVLTLGLKVAIPIFAGRETLDRNPLGPGTPTGAESPVAGRCGRPGWGRVTSVSP